jgi:hypothetical protein
MEQLEKERTSGKKVEERYTKVRGRYRESLRRFRGI